jgi:hypothetical protein
MPLILSFIPFLDARLRGRAAFAALPPEPVSDSVARMPQCISIHHVTITM